MRRAPLMAGVFVGLVAVASTVWVFSQQPGDNPPAGPAPPIVLAGPDAPGDSFDQALAQPAASPADKARQLATWMSDNPWRDLDLARRAELMRGLADRDSQQQLYSVRWTGSISAPASDDYQFTLHRSDYCRGTCRLWINDQLVIDATDIAEAAKGTANYTSTPVTLAQGVAVPLRIEFVPIPAAMRSSFSSGEVAETMVTLLWSSGGQSPSLIPPGALAPPAGFGDSATEGIQAEYFDGDQLTEPLLTRLDSAVELRSLTVTNSDSWSEHTTVRDDCFEALLSPEFLASVAGDLAGSYWNRDAVSDVLDFATAWQRRQYADWLAQHPEVLDADPGKLGDVFSPLATVPGPHRVELLRQWSLDRPVQQRPAVFYPDQYLDEESQYESVGRWLKGQYAADLEALATADLKRPDGSCRLELLRVLTHGAVQGRHAGWLREQLLAQMEGLPFNSDARASWLIALATWEEIAGGPPVRPNLGRSYLVEAMLVAQSNDMEFEVLGQHAPRLISLGHFAEGRALLDQYADRFVAAEQQATIAQWRAAADGLEANWNQRVADKYAAQAQGHRDNRISMLQSRLADAQQRGATALASKYRRWIAEATTSN